MSLPTGLRDGIAMVPGSSSGIGRAVAVLFAEDGADLALCDLQPDSRLPEQTPTTADAVRAAGRRVRFVHCDMSREDVVGAAVYVVERDFDRS